MPHDLLDGAINAVAGGSPEDAAGIMSIEPEKGPAVVRWAGEEDMERPKVLEQAGS